MSVPDLAPDDDDDSNHLAIEANFYKMFNKQDIRESRDSIKMAKRTVRVLDLDL